MISLLLFKDTFVCDNPFTVSKIRRWWTGVKRKTEKVQKVLIYNNGNVQLGLLINRRNKKRKERIWRKKCEDKILSYICQHFNSYISRIHLYLKIEKLKEWIKNKWNIHTDCLVVVVLLFHPVLSIRVQARIKTQYFPDCFIYLLFFIHWEARHLHLELLNCYVVLALLYGSEYWTISSEMRLEATEM